ncbi:MAG: hypothetical protein M0C28_45530 [Candidatus Moduliflexus flocculans]|nr:hypothetical protein [Candidatus Moduliflexus flocculans]
MFSRYCWPAWSWPGRVMAQSVTTAAFNGTVVDSDGKALLGAADQGRPRPIRERLRRGHPRGRLVRHPLRQGRRPLHRHRRAARTSTPSDAERHHRQAG